VSDLEQDFIDEGAQIVWVLQENRSFAPGTSDEMHAFMEDSGSDLGIRVGDGETEPTPGTFERSPFITTARGFAMVVRKADMRVMFANTHGNERTLNGQVLLEEVRAMPLE
jgi:hypothetical protein